MDVTEKIKKLQNERNWTDYKLAKEAGISQSTLATLFSKARTTPPKLDLLQDICDAFGITMAQFFLEDEQVEILNGNEKELLESFRKLSPNKQKSILEFLKD